MTGAKQSARKIRMKTVLIIFLFGALLSCRSKPATTDCLNNDDITVINLGGINCFLLRSASGFILIDNAVPQKRDNIEAGILAAGYKPEDLQLVILTHGDYDHVSNSTYFRDKYNVKIAMHNDDVGMVENCDMTWNRTKENEYYALKFRMISMLSIFFKTGDCKTFSPDLIIDESFDLSEYGSTAKIVCLPGHSKGSIGVLTEDGDLICGDLIYNIFKPEFLYINDLPDAKDSIERLKTMNIRIVYPGHGNPFEFDRFIHKYYDRKFSKMKS